MKCIATSLAVALAATTASATTIYVKNLCDFQIDFYDNHPPTVPLAPGGKLERFLPDGYMGMFRHGEGAQATLAEWTMAGGKAWYDISIIPTSSTQGPDYCPSLAECKRFTGGTGYNVQMQLAPRTSATSAHCRVLTCMSDGCDDAYQYPKDDTKTHNCPYGTDFDMVFCPGGTGGVTTAPPTPPPTTTAPPTTPPPTTTAPPTTAPPTTAPPTPAPSNETRSMDAKLESGSADFGSSVGKDADTGVTDPPTTETTAPPTEAPTTQAVTPVGTTEAPAVEANVKSGTTGGSSAVGVVLVIAGAVAAVAAVAMIVIVRRKKAELDSMDDKNSIVINTSTAATL